MLTRFGLSLATLAPPRWTAKTGSSKNVALDAADIAKINRQITHYHHDDALRTEILGDYDKSCVAELTFPPKKASHDHDSRNSEQVQREDRLLVCRRKRTIL